MLRLLLSFSAVWCFSGFSFSFATSSAEFSCASKESNDEPEDIKEGLKKSLINPPKSAAEPIIDSTVLAAVAALAGCATNPHLLCSIAFLPKNRKMATANTNGLILGRWQEVRAAEFFDEMMEEWYKGQSDSLEKTGKLTIAGSPFKLQLPDSAGDDERFQNAASSLLDDPFIKAGFISAFSKYTTLAATNWEAAKGEPTKYEFPHIFETKATKYYLAQTLSNFGFVVHGIVKDGHDRAGTLVVIKTSKDVSATRLARKRERDSQTQWNLKSGMMNNKGIFKGQAPICAVPFKMNFKHGLDKWLIVHERIRHDGYITEVNGLGRDSSVQVAMKLLRAGITMKSVGYHNCALNEESLVVDTDTSAIVLTDFSSSAWEEEDNLMASIDTWDRTPCFQMMNANSAVRLEATPEGKTVWRDDTSHPIEDELAILWMVYKLLIPIDDQPIDLFSLSMPDPTYPEKEINFGEHLSNPEKSCTGMYFGKGAKDIVEADEFPQNAQFSIAIDPKLDQHGRMCSATRQEATLRLLEKMFEYATKESKMRVYPLKDLIKPSQRTLLRRYVEKMNKPPPLPPRPNLPPLNRGAAAASASKGGSSGEEDELPVRRDNHKEETTEEQRNAKKLRRRGGVYSSSRSPPTSLMTIRRFRSPTFPHSYRQK